MTNERTTAGGSSDAGAPSEKPSSDDDASSPPKPGADGAKETDKDTANAAEDAGDDSQLGLILGGVAVFAVLAGGTFAVVRKRRSA